MTEIKNGDTVVVDLHEPRSTWHKVEGVLLEKSKWNNTSGRVRITKLPENFPTEIGSKKVGDEAQLVNLTKAPGFRVGTKALYVGNLVDFDGQIVIITEAIMYGAYDYRVAREDGGVAIVWHHELQRIAEPVKPTLSLPGGFKPGDKVVAVKAHYSGQKLTIAPEASQVPGPMYVRASLDTNPSQIGLFHADEIELVKPNPVTFKKGDIVKHKEGAHKYLLHRKEGLAFIVTEVNDDAKYPVRVRALGQVESRGYTHDELEAGEPLAQWEIELLDVPETPKFAVGGKIPETPKAEAVDGPAHYGGKDNPYEVIKVAEAWGFNKEAYLFNALKYLGRAGKKGDKVEDLKKLVFYVEREIALEEASGN